MSDDRRDQAFRAFGPGIDEPSREEAGPDDAPARFRGERSGDRFSGASGVLFEQAMAQTRMAICLTDPTQEDDPIVFANRAFRELTGYDEDEIMGHNCRFLQGPETDPKTVSKIRAALRAEEVVVVEILNYRKDGTPFWNALHLGPIYDDEDRLKYFFGSQWDVTDVHAARADEKHARTMSRELSHRMKNMFSVVGGIVAVTGRAHGFGEASDAIVDRIQALGRAYEPTLDEASLGSIEVGQAIRAVLAPYGTEEGGRMRLEGSDVRTDPNVVSTLGIALHELATNAIKYGALSVPEGHVTVDWRLGRTAQGEDALRVSWAETSGPSVTAPPEGQGTGMGIIDTLLELADGEMTRDWAPDGLRAVLTLPVIEADT